MRTKPDWQQSMSRYNAWWTRHEGLLVQAAATRPGRSRTATWGWWTLAKNYKQPDLALGEYKIFAEETAWMGDSFPGLFVNFGPGVVAAFLGSNVDIRPDTVWFETCMDWERLFATLHYEPENFWWNLTKDTTGSALDIGSGSFVTSITDLGGTLDILASLRGSQQLLMDCMECPENILKATEAIDILWWRYFCELSQILIARQQGMTAWLNIWCQSTWYPLQCDFSAMLSPDMFEAFVVPSLRKQCASLDYSIYHWDGPGQIAHLDHLLALNDLDGIQWVPGAGQPECGDQQWLELYKHIQTRRKLLVLQGTTGSLRRLFGKISPQGILLEGYPSDYDDAVRFIEEAAQWAAAEKRTLP